MRFTGTRDDEGLTDRNLIDKLRCEKKETKCLKLEGESLRITVKICTSFACHETRWWSAALFDSGIGSPASNLLVATLWGRTSFSMPRSFWNDRTRALATNQAYRNRAFDHRDRNVFIDIRWIRFKLGKLCPLDSPFSSQANCTRRNLKAKFVWWFSCQFSPFPPVWFCLFLYFVFFFLYLDFHFSSIRLFIVSSFPSKSSVSSNFVSRRWNDGKLQERETERWQSRRPAGGSRAKFDERVESLDNCANRIAFAAL